ncbi:hypothetical protein D187_003945 [Cystobacter fuscus DSM 2262]|uniref:Uncharacterized protein n=1 Tax=Cystobacter fuscus (strain ATCC 25194 / DSM 2262 / NBRC 100088 / M29) TaxID=1242864 RepID=S9QPF4_CYSF2|nr:hypothetical protein D187_003945 [Cystobacter fuscus DSM 2262]
MHRSPFARPRRPGPVAAHSGALWSESESHVTAASPLARPTATSRAAP